MRKALSVIPLMMFLVLPLWGESKSHSAIVAFNKGAQLLNAANCGEALTFFDQAIEKDDQFSEAYYARAVCKREKNNFEGAISDLNSAMRYKPGYVEAYALRGSILYEQDRWDEAIQDFNYVLEREPRNPGALLGRGLSALRQDRPSRARRDLAQFVRLVPHDPLVPRIRRFLGSFAAEDAGGPSATSSDAASASERPMSATSERLAKELFFKSREMADNFGNKVIRAENAKASGDIYSHPSVEQPRPR